MEIQTEQPLLIAIRGVREAVARFAEERKARALARETSAEEAAPAFSRPAFQAAPTPNEPGLTAGGPKPGRPGADAGERPGARRRSPASPRPAPHDPPGDHATPASPSRASSAEETHLGTAGNPEPTRPEDARQRLDALARLLDRRARQSPGSPADPVVGHEDA